MPRTSRSSPWPALPEPAAVPPAESLEAAALVTTAQTPTAADVAAVRDLGSTTPIRIADVKGILHTTL